MKTWSFQNGRGLKIGKWWCFLHCEFHFDHSPLSDLVTRQEKNFDENGETRLYFGKRCFNSTTIKELTTIKCSATNRFLSIFGEKRNEPPKHFHSKCWGHSRAIRLQRSHSNSHLTRSPSIHCALNHFVTKFLQWRWIPAKQPLLSIARVRIDGDRERAGPPRPTWFCCQSRRRVLFAAPGAWSKRSPTWKFTFFDLTGDGRARNVHGSNDCACFLSHEDFPNTLQEQKMVLRHAFALGCGRAPYASTFYAIKYEKW